MHAQKNALGASIAMQKNYSNYALCKAMHTKRILRGIIANGTKNCKEKITTKFKLT